MADSEFDQFGEFGVPLYLNPAEQHLLLAALNSNKSVGADAARYQQEAQEASPSTHEQTAPASVAADDSSPFLDGDFDDSHLDWDQNDQQFFGDVPGLTSGTSVDEDEPTAHDKRKNPDDGEQDDEGGGKRRESDTRSTKKPGRKQLTTEPTSKRKAQNRAAQRAFRERKEKHLKDLETKVEDLEKASEAANHENGVLRAHVDRLQTELKEYRKRFSSSSTSSSQAQASSQLLSSRFNWDLSQNFDFEFPKFGSGGHQNAASSATSPAHPTRASSYSTSSVTTGSDDLSNLFSARVLADANSRHNSADYPSFREGAAGGNKSRQAPARTSSEANTASPSSTGSQHGFVSSCVTTPEPVLGSPHQRRPGGTATGAAAQASPKSGGGAEGAGRAARFESPSSAFANQPNTPNADVPGIDWLAAQNDGVFNPVLFGDYRDPQNNIMNGEFVDFFDEAFPGPEFGSPLQPLEPALPAKNNLMQEIEDRQAGKEPEATRAQGMHEQMLTCNLLWDRVQQSEKVMSGEFDMDDLCSQLKAKARCSAHGAVIASGDVDAILGPVEVNKKHEFKMFA